ncbi:MAG: ribosome-associated translation inhibitor RaiA [Candidatus Moranbacteria bacterium]|nr:ribosome-associated translation inhibitor RaiA [Candidatus Moranbacteria bacterium]
MNTRFLSKGMEIDEQTKEYILKRLERVAKLVDEVSEFEVEVDRDKKGKIRVEIMIKTPHNLYRAEEVSVSVAGSTDMVIDKLEKEIDKKKNKNRDLKLRGKRSIKKKLVVDASARF